MVKRSSTSTTEMLQWPLLLLHALEVIPSVQKAWLAKSWGHHLVSGWDSCVAALRSVICLLGETSGLQASAPGAGFLGNL